MASKFFEVFDLLNLNFSDQDAGQTTSKEREVEVEIDSNSNKSPDLFESEVYYKEVSKEVCQDQKEIWYTTLVTECYEETRIDSQTIDLLVKRMVDILFQDDDQECQIEYDPVLSAIQQIENVLLFNQYV